MGCISFTISPYTYTNLSQDSVINSNNDSTIKLDDAVLLKIAKRQIFPKWGVIAEGIFRNQANQLVTIEGSGLMSSDTNASNSFDRHFSNGRSGVNGYSADWARSDLAADLASGSSYHKGKRCWDETRITGPTQISSLADARDLMGQELRNCSDDNDVSKDEFLGNSYQKNDSKRRLPDLADTKSGNGFANIVTCVNRAGASGDYDYVTFGLAVYDFDITPVAANDLKYIEAADDDYEVDDKNVSGEDILMGLAGNNVNKTGITFQNDDEEGTTSYLRNLTTQEVTQSAGLENSVTEENTISTDETYEWGMEQQIGLDLNLGGFGQGIVGDVTNAFAAPCMFPRATLSMSNSWHELWSTTNSKSDTKSATKTKTTNTEMTLPGHTIAVVKQSTNNKRTTENYQQPVILNYKVAVFAMSGDYYNGASGGIENSRYDKQWMSVLFDGSDDVATSGCYALGSLYNRGITNKDTLGYDGAKGKYRSWCDKAEWNSNNKIDWNSISSTLASDNRKSHRIELGTGKKATTIGDLATELPLLERAQMLTSKRESVTSSVEQIVALYPLDSVSMKTGAKQYVLVPRGQQTAEESDKLYLDQIKLEGYDKDAADFYEFDQDWGEWKLLDDEGDVIEDGGAKDESAEKGVVKSGLISIVTDENLDSQWVQVARASGSTGTVETHNIQWKIKHGDDAVIVSNESLNREDNQCMTDDEKDKVKTPVVEITVKNRERDVTNFEIDGTYKGPWNEEINLGHYISAVPVDQSGKISGAPVYWESKGTSGVEVTEDGSATFSKKGTYMVRPYSYNVDDVKIIPKDKNGEPIWIEVTANDKPQLSSIVINKPELDEDDATLTQGTRSLGFDLESYTKFYDQYGDKVEGTEEDPLPTIRYSVSPGENTQIDDEDILTVTREGTYTVSAKAYDKDGNDMDITIKPIKITVKEDNWLDSITFDQPAISKSMLTLSSSKDYVVVENLKSLLTYSDQNEDEWTGKKPNVTFSVDGVGDDAEIKGGNFYAYAPGTYIIEAHAQGFRIDPISVVVTEESSLVLKTEDPGKQFLYTEEDSIDLELERYVDASTSFGGKWKGKVPALKFTLDSDVEDAKIETRTVYDGDDDYNGEDRHFFKTNTTGDFTVHVEPLKASEYSEPLDDMHIRVVKGKKIASIEFKNIDEELGEEGRMVNLYNSVYPKIDLSKYINYYDGFGELIDPVKDHVRIPDVNIELIGPDDYPEGSYDFDGRVIKAYEGGTYIFKATMNVTNYDPNIGEETEDTILEAYTPISIIEIDWCHDFGEWETTIEPTCTENGIRVKRCKGGDKCINHEKGECDAEIEDVIPATGHAWSRYYSINTSDHLFYNKCDHCGIVNEDLNTSYSAGFDPDNGYININGEYRPMTRGDYASCTGTGTYYMEKAHTPIFERIGVEVPAIGHAWDTKFTVVKEPSCVETGLEVIKCTRKDCNAVREGEEYQRIIPKTDHVVDESAWAYDESDGIKEKETCENYGWKKNKCTVCSKDMYRPVAPTGHNWYDPTFEWAEDKTILTATRTCRNDKTHIEQEEVAVSSEVTKPATCTEKGVRTYTAESFDNQAFNDPENMIKTEDIDALGHELERVPGKEATCESEGYEEHWQCKRCNKLFSDEEGKTEINEPVVIKALDHDWGEPEYTWAKDGSQCTATSVCKHDAAHVITETVNTTSEESIGATCDLEGVTLYTATFENPVLKTQTKLIKNIPAKGHDWSEAELEWNFDDLTCKVTRTCKHDSAHVEKETVDITREVISPATCDAAGRIKHKAVFENKAFGDNGVARKTVEIKALGHSWDDAVYTWADDNSKCTAKRVCDRDKTHVEEETATVTSRVVTPATCTEKGVRTYTAEFGNKAFSKQTKQEDIDELGHDYSAWKKLDDDQHQRVCQHDPEHVEKANHKWNAGVVTKEATCEEAGVRTFTCEYCGAMRTEEIKATGHDWNEWTVTKEATETSEGEEQRTCKTDPSHVETRVIPVVGHKHGLSKVEAKTATCEQDGNKEYYVCDKGDHPCGRFFSDEAGTKEIEKEEWYIPSTGHDWNEWTVTKEATETSEGEEQRTCKTDPSHVETRVIPVVGHEHSWDTGKVTKAPTAEEEGVKTITCTTCGATRTEPIDNSKEKQSAKELADAKSAAKAELDKVDASKYSGNEKAAVEKAVADGKKAIDAAKTKEQVEAAKKAAQDIVKAQKTDVQKAADKKAAEEEADKEAADSAGSKINALPAGITTKDEGAIREARAAYNALTEDQKKKVDPAVLKKLEDAEKALEEAKKADEEAAKEKEANAKGADGTAYGKGAGAKVVDKAITSRKSDADPKGAKIAPLLLQSKSQGKNSIKLTWKKVSGAKKYVVYGNACGKNNKMKKLATRAVNNMNVTKIAKKLKTKTYHKFMVVALDKDNKVVSTSAVIHVATKGNLKKAANPKKVVVKAKVNAKGKKINTLKALSKTVVKKGKKVTLKASITKAKKTKVVKHSAIRFMSSNTKIATVSKKGVVKGIMKGTATIYAYAQNGVYKAIKITVK